MQTIVVKSFEQVNGALKNKVTAISLFSFTVASRWLALKLFKTSLQCGGNIIFIVTI